MAGYTIQLAPGTNLTELITLPISGGWLGIVAFSLSTGVNATIKSANLYFDEGTGTKWGRRVGGTQAGNWQNWTLTAHTRPYFWLLKGEGALKINYDATSPISVCIETSRGQLPFAHPRATGIPYGNPANGTIFSA